MEDLLATPGRQLVDKWQARVIEIDVTLPDAHERIEAVAAGLQEDIYALYSPIYDRMETLIEEGIVGRIKRGDTGLTPSRPGWWHSTTSRVE